MGSKWSIPRPKSRWLLTEPWTVNLPMRHSDNWEAIKRFSLVWPVWSEAEVATAQTKVPPGYTVKALYDVAVPRYLQHVMNKTLQVTLPPGIVFRLKRLVVSGSANPSSVDYAVCLEEERTSRRKDLPPKLKLYLPVVEATNAVWEELP